MGHVSCPRSYPTRSWKKYAHVKMLARLVTTRHFHQTRTRHAFLPPPVLPTALILFKFTTIAGIQGNPCQDCRRLARTGGFAGSPAGGFSGEGSIGGDGSSSGEVAPHVLAVGSVYVCLAGNCVPAVYEW